MRPDTLAFFAKFIESELGIVYAEHNYFQLQTRLEEIAKFYGLADVGALHDKAKAGITGDFRQLVLDVATNNETSFFRDPRVFQQIDKQIIPAILKTLGAGEKLRIWCAASSYGQEPYSLSILLHELAKSGGLAGGYGILATDIAERVLERAKQGKFSQLEIQRGLPAPFLVKYFTKDADNYWSVKPEIKSQIEFRKQNLKAPLKVDQRCHLVLCRNVLIYQKVESKIEILKRISEQLVLGGYLVLGAGESLLGLSNAFETVSTDGIVAYRLAPPAALNGPRAA